jgi:hypothetical protein
MLRKTEVDFLLACLRDEKPEDMAALAVPDGFKWVDFVDLAAVQGVSAILFKRLRVLRVSGEIPESALARLKTTYVKNSARQLFYSAEFGRVLKKLKAENLPVIALKGTHLANLVYRDPALRPMSDIDVLVREEDADQAFASLLGIGYRQSSKEAMEDHHHMPGLLNPSGIRVEIHTGIHEHSLPYAIDLAGTWDRAMPAEFAGAEGLVFAPEDLLLHLCVHAASHNFDCELRHLWDFREVIETYRDSLDTGVFSARAREWKVEKAAYVTLRLAEDLLGLKYPEGLLAGIRPAEFRDEYITWAEEQIFSDLSLNPSSFGQFKFSREAAAGGLLKTCWRTLFIPEETLAANYQVPAGSRKIYLYYFLRLKDLLVHYGPSVINRFRHGDEHYIIANRENCQTLKDWLVSR